MSAWDDNETLRPHRRTASPSRRRCLAMRLRAALFLLAFGLTSAFTCTKPDATCAALAELYAATNGSGWLDPGDAGWRQAAVGVATSYCSFNGVACSSAGEVVLLCVPRLRVALPNPSRVRRNLFLDGVLLDGTLPVSIGSLPFLTALCVSQHAYLASTLTAPQDSRVQPVARWHPFHHWQALAP